LSTEPGSDTSGQSWLIGGRVQGVGFRPFACVLAAELGLRGSVRNRGGHVEVVAQGEGLQAALFLRRLLSEHPPIARPELISSKSCPATDEPGFRILPSEGRADTGEPDGDVLPDLPMCDDCLVEMAGPGTRRLCDPFIACTQCGPRYTITRDVPFDRQATSMAEFPLCVQCRAEYAEPSDRRFHAQAMTCPDCGPKLTFRIESNTVTGDQEAVAWAIQALRDGAVVAVKGVGGYHLLCDASNDAAVRRLRARKRRPTKPLAVLFPLCGTDLLQGLRPYCAPDSVEAQTLRSPERPIVLVALRADNTLSPALAPGLAELGAMLPSSPLQAIIAGAFGGPLVATSGNISGEPVLTEAAEAQQLLSTVADAFLHHDRSILHPADDGIIRVIAGHPRPLRLGRGNAPMYHALPQTIARPVLALGGQMKVTLALGFGARVVISPHLGDLDSPRGLDLLEATVETLQRLHGVRALGLVCDAHGGYTGSRWAKAQSALPVLRIPHHHAHAAALAGEFPQEERWLCFTWDGAGLGDDGKLWGGEALLGRPGGWTRVATFRQFAPQGGDKAAGEPWRSAAALTWELGLDWQPPGLDTSLAHAAWQQRLNCPPTSSVGRLFDAAASFLNLAQRTSHEGEAAMAVEAVATEASDACALPLRERPDGVCEADWAPLAALLLDPRHEPGCRAATLHARLAATLVAQAIAMRRLHGPFAVGLGGGVFQNRRLAELSLRGLLAAGFRAHLPLRVPCNDAGLSFGQVVEAAARPEVSAQ
jgi:hydrogenase maturation protein HypF